MIKQIEDKSELNSYARIDIFSVRIQSLLYAYGCGYSFARFYAQRDGKGEITAIISCLDGNMTISLTESADKNELIMFSNAVGFSSLLCDESLEMECGYESGVVMKSFRKIELFCDFTETDEYPDLLDLYNFIDYGAISFDSWYVDISFRIRHGAAKAVALKRGDEIISSAILSSIYKNKAVLTGVRTRSEFRSNGYASALVSSVCCDFGGDVYLMREADRNENFYK